MCALTFPAMDQGDWNLEVLLNSEDKRVGFIMSKEYLGYNVKVEMRGQKTINVLTDIFVDGAIFYSNRMRFNGNYAFCAATDYTMTMLEEMERTVELLAVYDYKQDYV